jgi:hypothetical protein
MHNTHTTKNQKLKNSILNNVSLVVTQKQLIRLLVIKKLTHLQQCINLSPKHKNQNICITNKTTKQKLCHGIPNHQK